MEAGSPAWAGIDRKLDIYFLFLPRLPRVGGDRPLLEDAGNVCYLGSPAWAGIDPVEVVNVDRPFGLPRGAGAQQQSVSPLCGIS